MRELGRDTEKYSWQSFTIFISVVRKSFIKNLVMTKSKDRVSDLVNGHASRPYNKAGMHLLLIRYVS